MVTGFLRDYNVFEVVAALLRPINVVLDEKMNVFYSIFSYDDPEILDRTPTD